MTVKKSTALVALVLALGVAACGTEPAPVELRASSNAVSGEPIPEETTSTSTPAGEMAAPEATSTTTAPRSSAPAKVTTTTVSVVAGPALGASAEEELATTTTTGAGQTTEVPSEETSASTSTTSTSSTTTTTLPKPTWRELLRYECCPWTPSSVPTWSASVPESPGRFSLTGRQARLVLSGIDGAKLSVLIASDCDGTKTGPGVREYVVSPVSGAPRNGIYPIYAPAGDYQLCLYGENRVAGWSFVVEEFSV